MSTNRNMYDPFKKRHVVFSPRCARFLQDRGHDIVSKGKDTKHPDRDAYIFKNSRKLHDDLDEYVQLRKEEKEKYY